MNLFAFVLKDAHFLLRPEKKNFDFF